MKKTRSGKKKENTALLDQGEAEPDNPILDHQAVLQLYRLLMEKAGDVIWLLRRNGQIVEVNDAAIRTYGYSREELLEMNIRDLREKSTLPLLDEQLEQAFKDGIKFDTVHVRKSGEAFPIEVNANGGDFGGERLILGIVRDITDRKKTEAALVASERGYRTVIEDQSEMICRFRLDGSILFANHSYAASVGTTPEILMNGNFWQFIPEEDQPSVRQMLGLLTPVNPEVRIENRFETTEGLRWTLWINRALSFDQAGGVIEAQSTGLDITDRKRAEETLLHTQKMFSTLVENAPFGVYLVDADFRLRTINAGSRAVFGGIDPLIGRDFAEVLQLVWPEPFASEAIGRFRHTLETGESFISPPIVEPRANIEEIQSYDWQIHRITLPDGSFGVVCYFYDLSDQKRLEATVRRSAEIDAFRLKLADALRLAGDPLEIQLVAARVLGEHLGINRVAYFEMSGTDYVVNRDYAKDVPHLAGRYPIIAFGERLLTSYQKGDTFISKDVEADVELTKDERAAYAAIEIGAHVGVPLIKRGQLVAGLAAHSVEPRDWTGLEIALIEETAERTWAAVERARAEDAARAADKRLRVMADTAPILIWETDESGAIFLNRHFLEFFGVSFEEVEKMGWTQFIHPEDAAGYAAAWRESFARQQQYSYDCRFLRSDGEYRWLRNIAQPIGENRMVGCSLDITETKRAEEERERLLEREKLLRAEAEQANRLKDEFLATVSHELRTPLNAILGWATMARNDPTDQATISRALEIIERSAYHQNQIISDILEVSRIITGKLKLNLQPLRLSWIVRTAIETIRHSLEAKRIELKTHLETEVERIIEGDGDRLQQIIWNLLSNAVKFTPEGGLIEVSLRYRSGAAEIVVKDTGDGIEADFLPYVFDRFRQADGGKNRKHGGLGLGLAIARHLTELHGGSLTVESEGLKKGATFSLRLPGRLNDARPTGENSVTAKIGSDHRANNFSRTSSRLKNLKILVVDDEPDALALVDYILRAEDAHVLTAGSVDEALKIFVHERVDIIISDIGMPEKSGLDLIRQIRSRSNPPGAEIPVIALTAYARSEDSREALRAGFTAFLSKPLDPAAVIDTIGEIILSQK